MKNLITSVGRTVFKNKSVLAFRAPGLEPQQPKDIGVERQHPKNTGLDTGVMGKKPAQGTGFTSQQSNEAPRSWEQEKANIGFNADKHEMPWVAQAKKKTQQPLNDNITGAKKFQQNDQKFGASSKTSQATDFVRREPIPQEKQYAGMTKERTPEMKDRESTFKNQDTLNTAAEFVKKEASVNPTDFKSSTAQEQHGMFDSLKETASHAVDWVKEKLTGEHHDQQNLNQSFKAGEEAKDRVASKMAPEQTISENTVRNQAQPKVDKSVKSDIGKIIEKGIPDQNK